MLARSAGSASATSQAVGFRPPRPSEGPTPRGWPLRRDRLRPRHPPPRGRPQANPLRRDPLLLGRRLRQPRPRQGPHPRAARASFPQRDPSAPLTTRPTASPNLAYQLDLAASRRLRRRRLPVQVAAADADELEPPPSAASDLEHTRVGPKSAARQDLGALLPSSRIEGKRITSRRFFAPARIIIRRSIPRPQPLAGGIPYSSARTNSSSCGWGRPPRPVSWRSRCSTKRSRCSIRVVDVGARRR